MNRYLGIVLATISFLLTAGALHATDDATLLPNAIQYFMDANGRPLANGKVYFYTPSTTTAKTTWTSADKATPQANPVLLGVSGRPTNPIYGDGSYRQLVKDQNNNTIWDFNTTSTGGGSSGSGVAFSEGVMVGAIIPWANLTLPAKYLYTAGQAISRTGYPELFTAITFNPSILCTTGIATITVSTDISDKTPIGAPVEFSCFAPGTTVSSKTSGQLTLSTNATTTASVSGYIFPWGNGDGSTTFNVPELRGSTLVGRNNMLGTASATMTSTYFGTNPNALNALGGSSNTTLTQGNLPVLTALPVAITDPGHVHSMNTGTYKGQADGTSLGAYAGGPYNMPWASNTGGGSGSVGSATTGISGTVSLGGSATPFSRVQPSKTSDFIIKALPDDTPSGPGVSSIGGMTGAISCGTSVTCTANTISVTISPSSFSVQSANTVLAGPTTGAAATPTFRALVGADLPAPAASTLGGVNSITSLANNWVSYIDTAGLPHQSQPAFSNISGSATVAQGGTGQTSLTANALLTGNGTSGINQVALTGLVVGNGASAPTAYAGVSCTNQVLSALSAAGAGTCISITSAVLNITPTSCTNQFVSAISAAASGTCTTVVLAGAQFANQGTSTTVLHGNAAGNPTWGAVSLTADVTGTLGLTNGGAGGSLTASNGGIIYSDASRLQVLAGTATPSQCLLSGASSAPTWGACAGGASVTAIAGNTGAFTLSTGITNSTNDIRLSLTNATLQSSAAGLNPTGAASSTVVMAGLGSTCTLTPTYSTRVKISFVGAASNSTSGSGGANAIYYGSGAAPANGAAVTGTAVTGLQSATSSAANAQTPVSNNAIVTGLTPGVAYWFDLGQRNITSGTWSLINITCNGMEF